MQALIDRHDAAYELAQGCPVYTGPDTYHAVRSGARSAQCGAEWGRLYAEMKRLGLKSSRFPHLFKEGTPNAD
jgi:hypothetical protein